MFDEVESVGKVHDLDDTDLEELLNTLENSSDGGDKMDKGIKEVVDS